MIPKPLRVEVFKKTNDEWYPSYFVGPEKMSLVRLTLLEFIDRTGYRVCVWGADDCGMEKDFLHKDYADKAETLDYAGDLFYDLVDTEFIDKPILKGFGFICA